MGNEQGQSGEDSKCMYGSTVRLTGFKSQVFCMFVVVVGFGGGGWWWAGRFSRQGFSM